MRSTLLSACGALFLSAGTLATDATWMNYTYKTGPWQPPQLLVDRTGAENPGLIFIPVRNANTAGTAVTIYENNGKLVYQGPEEVTMDFKMQKLFGKDVITFWSGTPQIAGGYGYGKVHILDNTYNEIYTITLDEGFLTADSETFESYIDVHEHIITPRNTIIVSAINVTQHDLSSAGGPTDGWMTVSQFYEIDIPTNKVVYKWNALDHQDLIPLASSKYPPPSGNSRKTPWDCYHMNSVQATNEGFLVSLRFFWSAYYLNQDGTVRWQFSGAEDEGDFRGEDNRFSWQHHARIYNETDESLVLSLFNNANGQQESQSATTGMAWDVDLIFKTSTMMHNVTDPNDPIKTQTQGSFQFLGAAAPTSHLFMGYGSVPKVKEYDGAGNVVFTGQFAPLGDGQSYRAFKFPWTATPMWSPVAVAETSDDSTTVYMSWNGATEYDNWAIYSIPSANSNETTLLTTVERDGFESHVTLQSLDASYLKIAARKGSKTLRFSDAISV
ncbi:ASST-domain-containing protein [Penicillium malachiteum]|nr:ASST-domain-containing protein [Penicillium malachiteum]